MNDDLTDDLTLFLDRFWISPYAFTCYVALKEKGVPFEIRELSLGDGHQKSADYASRSVTARVPALWHGDFGLAESTAIVEYLDEVFPEPRLLPKDRRDRARARQILSWIRSDLAALREERSTTTMFYERAEKPLSEKGRAAADKLVRVAETVVPQGRPTLAAEFSIADADLSFMLHRLILNGEAVPERLRAYAAAHWERPSIQAFVSHARVPFVSYSY